ncbi:4498_t:CDS:2 [Paraglomus brasilianum]|uniref:4498_t:CDS:1 n=1 Tax=Paraglomus brasilianum TaxID=144538 RepID=A0A9N8ZAA1_9GLOM|nr:4498_t:CDS:2 [Paraglomus brasilianum]
MSSFNSHLQLESNHMNSTPFRKDSTRRKSLSELSTHMQMQSYYQQQYQQTPSSLSSSSLLSPQHMPPSSPTHLPPIYPHLSASPSSITHTPSQLHHSPSIHTSIHHTQAPSRRLAHIRSEQKRRENINSGFEELKNIVPTCRGCADSKAIILKKAVHYIQALETEVRKLKSPSVHADHPSLESPSLPPVPIASASSLHEPQSSHLSSSSRSNPSHSTYGVNDMRARTEVRKHDDAHNNCMYNEGPNNLDKYSQVRSPLPGVRQSLPPVRSFSQPSINAFNLEQEGNYNYRFEHLKRTSTEWKNDWDGCQAYGNGYATNGYMSTALVGSSRNEYGLNVIDNARRDRVYEEGNERDERVGIGVGRDIKFEMVGHSYRMD